MSESKQSTGPIVPIVLLSIGTPLLVLGLYLVGTSSEDSDESNPWGDIDSDVGVIIAAGGAIVAIIGLVKLLTRHARDPGR